jgi:hypothetical protein
VPGEGVIARKATSQILTLAHRGGVRNERFSTVCGGYAKTGERRVGSAAPEWWALARGAQSGVVAAGLMPCDGVLRRAHEHG